MSPSSAAPDGEDVAVLDFYDQSGRDLLGDMSVPSWEAWDWWVTAAGLRLESMDGVGHYR